MQKTASKNNLVKRQVVQALREVLSDPDAGLELVASFEQRLRSSVRSAKKGKTRDLRAYLKKA